MALITRDEDFATWLAKVDRSLTARTGLGVDDLADAPYRDYFADEMDPREAAALVLSEWNDCDDEMMEALGLADFL
jgi:hypothetical protein